MSGIYIPGMEMPPCHFKTSECYHVHGSWVVYPDGTSKLHIMVDSYDYTVDVVPVPDHGRLIDADALIEAMARMLPWAIVDPTANAFLDGLSAAYGAIQSAPAIIPADKEAGE